MSKDFDNGEPESSEEPAHLHDDFSIGNLPGPSAGPSSPDVIPPTQRQLPKIKLATGQFVSKLEFGKCCCFRRS